MGLVESRVSQGYEEGGDQTNLLELRRTLSNRA